MNQRSRFPVTITRWSVDRPEVGTVLVRYRLKGQLRRQTVYLVAKGIVRRYTTAALQKLYGEGPVIELGWTDLGAVTHHAEGIQHLLRTDNVGQKVATDWLQAVHDADHPLMRDIGEYVIQATRPNPVPPPQRQAGTAQRFGAEGAALRSASTVLRRHGRTEDAGTVDQLLQRLGQVDPREQATSAQAARAIVDAYDHLERIPAQYRDEPDVHGRTPRQDADDVVDSAMHHLQDVARVSREGDLQALRALRQYSQQWQPRQSPLQLED